MELNLGQWIAIGICAILIIGYVRGYITNRQRAKQISLWLLEGLKPWGQVTGGRKLPRMVTGGRLEVQQAQAPLRQVEAVFLLAPRENLLFWILYRLQGKRDELLVWITFQSKPEQAVEVARKGDKLFENRLKAADKPSLSIMSAPPPLQIASEEKEGAILAGKVQSFVQRFPSLILRLALRANKPHLFVRTDLRIVQSIPADEFFTALSELRKDSVTRV